MNRPAYLAALAVLSLGACSPKEENTSAPAAQTAETAQVGQTGPLSRDAIENTAYAPPPAAQEGQPAAANAAQQQAQPALIRAQVLL